MNILSRANTEKSLLESINIANSPSSFFDSVYQNDVVVFGFIHDFDGMGS
jgi:hypothetical protein